MLPPETTLFIPVYNEADILEKQLRLLLNYLEGLDFPCGVLVGSNGSTDETPRIGRDLERRHRRVTFFHIERRGPGLAFSQALLQTRRPRLVCMDVDLSVELNFIERAAKALDEWDAVVGSKHMAVQKRPMVRVVASEIFVCCARLLLQMPFHDYAIGAKAYRTQAVRPLMRYIDRHTFYTQELLYHLLRENKKILEIPVNCSDHRKSKFNLVHEGLYRYSKLFGLWGRHLRTRVYPGKKT